MTDLQMYILVGIPLVGILSNTALYIHLSGRMETRLASMESRFDTRFSWVDARLGLILDKISDMDGRISVLEDRASHQ